MVKTIPIAIKQETTFSGIGIFGVDYSDGIHVFVADIYDGKPKHSPRACKMCYTSDGRPYFRHNNQREFLADYAKVKL